MPTRPLGRIPRVDGLPSPARALATILCVDDDRAVLETLGLFLMSEDFEVISANDGREALLRLQEHLPDLIITDYRMPGMTGLELCKRVRASRSMRCIPIIVHTAVSLPTDPLLYDGTVRKPVDPHAFAVQIRVLLASRH
jgi:CheY-like chemotaxis protein